MDAEIFKVNLRGLLEARGMSQRELAKRCDIGEQWVRRVCSRGLTRVEGRNKNQLEAICELLGVSPVERLWSPDLQVGRDEAAWYASKVEQILNETRSVTDFEGFVDISEDSIIEMVQIIDRLHTALKRNQEKLAELHEKNLDQRRERGDPFPSRTTNDVEQLRRATEYSAKLRQVFRTSSIKNSDSISLVTDEIDSLYFEKQASRILTIFRDRDQKSYEAWLVFFRSRGMLKNSVAVALARFNEDQALTWLASHPPSNDSCNGPFDDWIRESMLATKREAMKKMSTHGGDVASGE